MSGEISKNNLFNYQSFIFSQKANQLNANAGYFKGLTNLKIFVDDGQALPKMDKYKTSLFMNTENQ